jgi:hypothetical protein
MLVRGTVAAYCGSHSELINMAYEKIYFLKVTSSGAYIYHWALKGTAHLTIYSKLLNTQTLLVSDKFNNARLILA